jgi:hypothetical protein
VAGDQFAAATAVERAGKRDTAPILPFWHKLTPGKRVQKGGGES